jgi:hypothetical protein
MTFRGDLIAENERLKAENETLRAQIASARADGAWRATLKQATELISHQAWLGLRAYLADKAAEAGFGRTPESIDAYRAAEKRKLKAELRARVAADPSERAHVVKTFGAAYLDDEPEAETLPAPGVIAKPAPARSDGSFESVYLPPQQAAAAVARAMALANGTLVEMPADPVARAILRADARARGEPEPGSRP